MKLPPLVTGRLVQRYKRFLADVSLDSGETVTAHCANPGSMMGLAAPGNRVWLSVTDNPARKLRHSWQIVEAPFDHGPELVGIDTGLPNGLVSSAIADGTIAELTGYSSLRREVKYGQNSRIDILLEDESRPRCFVEVKNVHLMRRDRLAEFPDCVTTRGAKHLEELGDQVEAGSRAVMVYLIQMKAERFAFARDLDPGYARAFERARERGVEAIAYCCRVTPQAIEVANRVTIET